MGSTVFCCCRLGINFVNHLKSNFWHTGFISEFTIFKKYNGKLKCLSTLANRLVLAASKILTIIYFAFTLLKMKLFKFFLLCSWTE